MEEETKVEVCRAISHSLDEDEFEHIIRESNAFLKDFDTESSHQSFKESVAVNLQGSSMNEMFDKEVDEVKRQSDQSKVLHVLLQIQEMLEVQDNQIRTRQYQVDNIASTLAKMVKELSQAYNSNAVQTNERQTFNPSHVKYDGQNFHKRDASKSTRNFQATKENIARPIDNLFSFKTNCVKLIFFRAMKNGLTLPPVKNYSEVGMVDNPMYCLYHRRLGHRIDQCYGFKKWAQQQINEGNMVIPPSYLKEEFKERRLYEKRPHRTCHAITLGSDSEDELNFLDEDEEKLNETQQIKLRNGKVLHDKQGSTHKDKEKQIEIEESLLPATKKKRTSSSVDYNILAHLKKLPSLLSIYDALLMSKELRETLIQALQNPDIYQSFFAEASMKEALYAMHMTSVTFTDKDLLLGTNEHNRPLYVTGLCDGEKITRMLIDPGSSVNLLTVRTLRNLSMDVQFLSREKITIQGFNSSNQQTLGSIILPIEMGDLRTEAKVYVCFRRKCRSL